jgi:hypothetical protein
VRAGVVLEHVALAGWPLLEPPRLVVDAVAGEEPLADEAGDRAVDHQRRDVVQRLLVVERQAERHHQPAGVGQQLLQARERLGLQAGAKNASSQP